MNLIKAKERARLLAVLAGLLPAACFFPPEQPANPLIGTWASPDNNRVTFAPGAVVLTPDKGQPTTMSGAECNGVYKLAYGRMETQPLERLFPTQADLQVKLKRLLVKPDYPVADVTCDRGGTTYLMLDDREVLAVYRDGGVGGVEQLNRL